LTLAVHQIQSNISEQKTYKSRTRKDELELAIYIGKRMAINKISQPILENECQYSHLTKCIANGNPKEIPIADSLFVCPIISALKKHITN
jgi:hypothetical protein